MIDRTKTEEGAAQDHLWQRLYKLKATGEAGFEGFLAAVLREVTGQPFHVVKSGTQSGTDVRSEPRNLLRIGLESKHYRRETRLPLDELLYKLNDASAKEPPVDVWILASTRGIDANDREKLDALGERLGIEVIVWDWSAHETGLADLAVVCASAPDACRSRLGSDARLNNVLELIRGHAEFESSSSRLRSHLLMPEVGYVSCREGCWRWLEDAQSSRAKAKSRLGGDHNLGASEYGVVRRSGIHHELGVWLEDGNAGIAGLVGDEGTGKSWAALDWCAALREGARERVPLVVYIPARKVQHADAKRDIAEALRKQAGRDADFWRRRLELWEKGRGDGLRILLIVDGLNQNFMFKDWADWLQPLLEQDVRAMYRVVVTCWRNWWTDKLFALTSLEPAPLDIEVQGFDDAELDTMLAKMGVQREDFAESVLKLMRVPRLSRVVMTHRQALADSGDVTAERVIYEDWKDRIRRQGTAAGLDDARMKEFVAGLGARLREDVERAVSRRNIMDILCRDSGTAGEELEAAIAQLTSGGWFRPGDRPDTFRIETDRIAYVLAVALMSELKWNAGGGGFDAVIAEFLDPLKAHSLGAKILRAATSIALVEPDTSAGLRRAVVERWLDEQNFGDEDFESIWRVAGLDAKLFLDIAESDWLAARANSFRDEVLVKALANAAAFAEFDATLKRKLVEWLGTAWPDASDTEEKVASRHREWTNSNASKGFEHVRVQVEGEWEWLGHRAVAVMSYVARAPYVRVLEAWCLSRALMDRAWHLDDVAWLFRANGKDPDEAAHAMAAVVNRLERIGHPTGHNAAKNAKTAMSHVRRSETGSGGARDSDGELPRPELDALELEGEALFKAVRNYLGPDGWKRCSAPSGAALIDALVAGGLPRKGREIALLLRNLREIVAILSPLARRRLASAFEEELAAAADEEGKTRPTADLRTAALLMRLYDAPTAEQSGMLLAAAHAEIGREWWPIFRRPSAGDLDSLDFAGASRDGLVLWLEFVGRRLDEELIQRLDALPSLATSEDREIRRRAVEMAAHGRHLDALGQFAESKYAAEVGDASWSGRMDELARNRALLALEQARPRGWEDKRLSAESAALRVKLSATENETTDASLADFERYLERELEATKSARSWSMQRYWFSYLECVELLVKRGSGRVVDWLADWTPTPRKRGMGSAESRQYLRRVECALMNNFPVLDTIRALKETAPDVSLRAYNALWMAAKQSVFSGGDGIEGLPFELSRSPASDAACDERVASAATDKELLNVVFLCHRHGRLDWLLERIAELEASERPGDVARSFTLLGCCDTGTKADSLWAEFGARKPADRWLGRVFREGLKDYGRNRAARTALADFWSNDEESPSRHAWKQVEESCDRRIDLWLKGLDRSVDEAPYARRLARRLGSQGLSDAVRKDRDRRTKLLFHTRIGPWDMAPWGE